MARILMAVLSSDREGGVQISEEDGVKWLTETSNVQDASISKQKYSGKGGRKKVCASVCER